VFYISVLQKYSSLETLKNIFKIVSLLDENEEDHYCVLNII